MRHWFPLTRDDVARREQILIAQEDAIFRAACDRATTDEERAYWDDFIALRERNLDAAAKSRP